MNKFQAQFQTAYKNGEIPDFIHFYQMIDVLIIDDIQELTGKTGTQNAFFNIFNHLQLAGKQLILTSDKPPVELKDIEQRLLTRFKWGLSAQLNTPDHETKLKIIRVKAQKLGAQISDDVVAYLADNISANVREIEGALSSLVANASFLGRKITTSLAKEILKVYVQLYQKEITIDHIIKVVCEYLNLDFERFNSTERTREIAQARQIAMYLSKQHTKAPLTTIGSAIGATTLRGSTRAKPCRTSSKPTRHSAAKSKRSKRKYSHNSAAHTVTPKQRAVTGYVTAFLYLCGMRKVYHFKMLRTAAPILLGAPAFVAAGLIRLHPDNLPVRIAGYAGILFFGGCFAAGLLVLRRLARNSEALTLTPEKLTVRQPNGREYALKWNEIRSFREADINGQPFIAVITSEPQKPAVQSHNRLRLWLRRLDERLTGSAINISPSSIHCRRDELYATLCEYLEKYGR